MLKGTTEQGSKGPNGLAWMDEIKRSAVVNALTQTKNMSRAAELLGVSRDGLRLLRRKLQIKDSEWDVIVPITPVSLPIPKSQIPAAPAQTTEALLKMATPSYFFIDLQGHSYGVAAWDPPKNCFSLMLKSADRKHVEQLVSKMNE